MMTILDQTFRERLAEIDTYLDLLAGVEEQVQTGPPRLGANGPIISTTQQRILYSSVFLQLYNLVEATVTKCVESLCNAITSNGCLPSDLSPQLRKEWVRFLARTHTDLNYENRLNQSLLLCEHLISASPVEAMEIEKGGGGNWNDEEIFKFAQRLGCFLEISRASNEAVKRPFRNDVGAMQLIVKLRNDLAHGSVSFGECGDGITVTELRELKERTSMYLSEVVQSFNKFVEAYEFLQEDKRPTLAETA